MVDEFIEDLHAQLQEKKDELALASVQKEGFIEELRVLRTKSEQLEQSITTINDQMNNEKSRLTEIVTEKERLAEDLEALMEKQKRIERT